MSVAEYGVVRPGGRTAKRAIRISAQTVTEIVRKQLNLRPLDVPLGLKLAQAEEERGAIKAALRIYIQLVLWEPYNLESQVGLARCALQDGNNELAIQAASVAVALAPADPRGFLLSGQACLALRHFKEAKEDLTHAIERARLANNTAIVNLADQLLSGMAAPVA